MGAPKGNQYAVGNSGRPSGYKAEYSRQAKELCTLGATVNELARFFQVGENAIYDWANKNKEFAKALQLGREACDERVERALYHKALGFEKEIEKEVLDKNGEKKVVVEKIYIPPSDTAIQFYLKNRKRSDWRDRQEHEIGRVGDFDKMSDNELEAFIEGTFTEISPGYSRAKVPRIEESSGKRSSRVRSSGMEDD
jgi:hypothetical protein